LFRAPATSTLTVANISGAAHETLDSGSPHGRRSCGLARLSHYGDLVHSTFLWACRRAILASGLRPTHKPIGMLLMLPLPVKSHGGAFTAQNAWTGNCPPVNPYPCREPRPQSALQNAQVAGSESRRGLGELSRTRQTAARFAFLRSAISSNPLRCHVPKICRNLQPLGVPDAYNRPSCDLGRECNAISGGWGVCVEWPR
jgi:hypothetical protein